MNDFELIKCCLEKEKKAWNDFVEKFSKLVYNFILKTFKEYGAETNHDDVDELHNDVFLTFLENNFHVLRVFEGRNGCSLASYIRTITIRKTIDHLRSLKSNVSLDEEISTQDGEKTRFFKELAIFDSYQKLEEEEAAKVVEMLLIDLDEKEKHLCSLCFFENQEPALVAQQLDISIDNFYVRKQRLLNKLKEIAIKKNLC